MSESTLRLLVTIDGDKSVEIEPNQGDYGRLEESEGKPILQIDLGVVQLQRLAHFTLLRLKRQGKITLDFPVDWEAFRDAAEAEDAPAPKAPSSTDPVPTPG